MWFCSIINDTSKRNQTSQTNLRGSQGAKREGEQWGTLKMGEIPEGKGGNKIKMLELSMEQ